jgi:uncharacterized repeat protein (TIGR03803 family)
MRYRLLFLWTLIAAILLLGSSFSYAADTEKVIYNFTGGKDEGFPYSSLIFDAKGNLYGTDCGGGVSDYYGTAFALTPAPGKGREIDVLHIFTGATDGSCPRAGLIRDVEGTLYGTTYGGGNLNHCDGLGCGTVFKLSKQSNGTWQETVLYSFTDGADGGYPYASLLLDASGNLYGTTSGGGNSGNCSQSGCGVVFELMRQSKSKYKEEVLYNFTDGSDGAFPDANLIFDASGNLYGTASEGGDGLSGTVFELTPGANGWQETTLYAFHDGSDGGFPVAGLTFDDQGNLYGTASNGGTTGNGVVFELMPGSDGWTEDVLYAFNGSTDGRFPLAGVVFDGSGNLYGTNSYGGNVEGTVFELTPASQGWTETILHGFTGGTDGGEPQAGVILDVYGNLYGTAEVGGSRGWGCVFELKPASGSKNLRLQLTPAE